jgi:hypothetical protein
MQPMHEHVTLAYFPREHDFLGPGKIFVVFRRTIYAMLLISASALNRAFRGLPGAPGGASYF